MSLPKYVRRRIFEFAHVPHIQAIESNLQDGSFVCERLLLIHVERRNKILRPKQA